MVLSGRNDAGACRNAFMVSSVQTNPSRAFACSAGEYPKPSALAAARPMIPFRCGPSRCIAPSPTGWHLLHLR